MQKAAPNTVSQDHRGIVYAATRSCAAILPNELQPHCSALQEIMCLQAGSLRCSAAAAP